MGAWAAGTNDLDESEVVLILGVNPLVSHGLPVMAADPVRRLKRARARGTKIICIDPRRTETGQFADLLLQPLPGQDVAIMAGIIRLVLANGWEDTDFCASHIGAQRMADLRAAFDLIMPPAGEPTVVQQAPAPESGSAVPAAPDTRFRSLPWIAVGVLAIIAASLGTIAYRTMRPAPLRPTLRLDAARHGVHGG